MEKNKTIIISCAGMGRRLGIGTTKALIDINGKPLIIRMLENLKAFKDIRVVVGYQAEKVISTVNSYRKDITFVFNHDYMNNGTGASVSLALKNAGDYILTLDGDTIIHPEDFKRILTADNEFVGICNPSTDDPVLVNLDEENNVISFKRNAGVYEWTGIMQVKSKRINPDDGHVYQLIEPILPLPSLMIRLKEIDTVNDYDKAIRWVNNGYTDLPIIGILGGMGSYATVHYFKRIIDSFPAEKEWDRPRIIIDNYCTMPSRVRAILYNEKRNELIQSMISSLKNLIDAGATKIILACNTSHVFLPYIYEELPSVMPYIINIINECVTRVINNADKSALLLASEGTIKSQVYQKAFSKHKYVLDLPSEAELIKLRDFIEAVKQNKITDNILNNFIDYINNFDNNVIILGCTELPILYEKCKNKIFKTIYDPLECTIDTLKNDIIQGIQ